MMHVNILRHRNHHGDSSKKGVVCLRVSSLFRFCFFVGLAAFLLAGPSYSAGPAGDSLLADRHQGAGINCQGCHQESPPAKLVQTATCMKCHGDMAKLISKASKLSPNPHASPHEPPAETKCETCHHVHKKSENSCSTCHEEFVFKVP
jgi:Zn finger protein HypA/HybF involved in hydrogenase expression